MSTPSRGQWSSQLGFVLAAAGSAIGLGNIWRFPYSAGENGGAAFVLIYLLCVVLLGLPVMLLEISIGRHTQKNPVGAILAIRPSGAWKYIGFLALITGIGILSFYSVIAGQVLAELVEAVQGLVFGHGAFAVPGAGGTIVYFGLFLVLTVLVVAGGVQRGIERWAKILMPLLLVMMLGIIFRGLLLPGAMEGVRYLVMPDFSKISLKVVLDAMAQAFFSLSLGMGAMLTYGSYLSKRQNLLQCASWVVFFDTLIAIAAGFMIFPAVFALGMRPNGGPDLIFKVLPKVFENISGGLFIAVLFFFLLCVAALTSTVSLLEVVAAYFIDEKGWSRSRTVWLAGLVTFIIGIPAALAWTGMAPWSTMKILGKNGVFSAMDFTFVSISLPLGSLALCIFAAMAWGLRNASEEIASSTPAFRGTISSAWIFFIRWVCPIFIAIILLTQFH